MPTATVESPEARQKRLANSINKYRTDKQTLLDHRYRMILQRVTGRSTIKHPSLEGQPYLSKAEYAEWCKKNMVTFDKLHKEWEESGYASMMSPSIDRIDNNLSYTPSNMQWLTTLENSLKRNK